MRSRGKTIGSERLEELNKMGVFSFLLDGAQVDGFEHPVPLFCVEKNF